MDKTAVPVKLPEPTASAWKAYLLGERGRDELRSTLADALPGKTSRTLNSQLARLLNGDGQEICGWLDPDTPRGRRTGTGPARVHRLG